MEHSSLLPIPQIALLQAHYFNTKGVFSTDFPDRPPTPFNYTGAPLTANLGTKLGTRVSKIAFNSTLELVLQDTNLLTVESHPIHLHGYNFFIVGTGVGNFDPKKDPAKFNLVDPPERNTVGVPTGGWAIEQYLIMYRCVVHALSLGAAYYVGNEDCPCGRKWERLKSIYPASTCRPSTLLVSSLYRITNSEQSY